MFIDYHFFSLFTSGETPFVNSEMNWILGCNIQNAVADLGNQSPRPGSFTHQSLGEYGISPQANRGLGTLSQKVLVNLSQTVSF